MLFRSVYVGNKALMVDKNLPYDKNISIKSGTIVYVSSKMNYYGAIKISDKIKADSAAAVRSLLQDGYNVIMLTGDRKENADYIAKKLGITNVYSELLPDGKVNEVSTLINEDGKHVLFVGDGINDAPVLAMSDVGVAMGGIGSDATIEAADVVLMNDEPSKICTGLKISKITRKIVTENIMFSLRSEERRVGKEC